MRTPSQAVTNSAPRATSERRQRAREAQAEALAAEYDRTADSGYEEVRAPLNTICEPHDIISQWVPHWTFPMRADRSARPP